MSVEYDLVILGGGPGGYVAAIRASQLGMKVALVEKNKVGGTCLHDGCVPTKTLLKSAERFRDLKNSRNLGIAGINPDELSIDFNQVNKRKKDTITQLYNGVLHLLKQANVDIYNGYGRILGPSIFSPMSGTISVEYPNERENTLLSPKNVLIATGARHRELDDFQIDGNFILSSDELLKLETLPESMIIIGGGVIGIEFASMLHDFGVKVTILEANHSILPNEDTDIQNEATRLLKKRGIHILTNVDIDTSSLNITDKVTFEITYENKTHALKTDKVLIAIGREANIAQIGIENTNIQIKNGMIVTNDMYQTEEMHIYAIGDCIGGIGLAHVASKEGIIAVEHMAGKKPFPLHPTNVPHCIYSYPEISRIGLTEQEAKEKGYQVKIGRASCRE